MYTRAIKNVRFRTTSSALHNRVARVYKGFSAPPPLISFAVPVCGEPREEKSFACVTSSSVLCMNSNTLSRCNLSIVSHCNWSGSSFVGSRYWVGARFATGALLSSVLCTGSAVSCWGVLWYICCWCGVDDEGGPAEYEDEAVTAVPTNRSNWKSTNFIDICGHVVKNAQADSVMNVMILW